MDCGVPLLGWMTRATVSRVHGRALVAFAWIPPLGLAVEVATGVVNDRR
jgi:hypothetical protein